MRQVRPTALPRLLGGLCLLRRVGLPRGGLLLLHLRGANLRQGGVLEALCLLLVVGLPLLLLEVRGLWGDPLPELCYKVLCLWWSPV